MKALNLLMNLPFGQDLVGIACPYSLSAGEAQRDTGYSIRFTVDPGETQIDSNRLSLYLCVNSSCGL